MVGHMGRVTGSLCTIHLSETEGGETRILIPLQSTCQRPNFLLAGPISQSIYHFLEVSKTGKQARSMWALRGYFLVVPQTGNQAFGMWALRGYLRTKAWYRSITEYKVNCWRIKRIRNQLWVTDVLYDITLQPRANVYRLQNFQVFLAGKYF